MSKNISNPLFWLVLLLLDSQFTLITSYSVTKPVAFHPMWQSSRSFVRKSPWQRTLGFSSNTHSSARQSSSRNNNNRPATEAAVRTAFRLERGQKLLPTRPAFSTLALDVSVPVDKEKVHSERQQRQQQQQQQQKQQHKLKQTVLASWTKAVNSKATEIKPVVDAKTVRTSSSAVLYSDENKLHEEEKQLPPTPEKEKTYPRLQWTKQFGRRSPEYTERLKPLVHLRPGDEGYFDVSHIKAPGVTVVRNRRDAQIVMEKLMHANSSNYFHACDTEVMDIDLKTVGPVGNGYVTCVSVYSGPDFDYGLGDGNGTTLWIDNLDDACGVLQEFKEWFENQRFLKVWHNYGFDRHVMWNEGIDVQGFAGDTMHMARLQNTSRGFDGSGQGYSLEQLTNELMKRGKEPMKQIFGVKRLRKDGSEGKLIDLPAIEVMQRDPQYREKWITYSAFDAQATWQLHEVLRGILHNTTWSIDDDQEMGSLYNYYWQHMRPFGEVLTDMERRGIRVDSRDYLAKVECHAREDRERHSRLFREWAATKIGPDGLALNPASAAQLSTFLFGGAENPKTGEILELQRVFKVPRSDIPEEALEAYRIQADAISANSLETETELDFLEKLSTEQLKKLCKEHGLKMTGKKVDVQDRLREYFSHPEKQPTEIERKIASMKVAELKVYCQELGLLAKGKKEELLTRVRDHFAALKTPISIGDKNQTIDSLSDEVLRDCVKSRDIPVPENTTRLDLIKILKDDIDYVEGLKSESNGNDVAVAQRLDLDLGAKGNVTADLIKEVQEKALEPPKFIDVTIQGLGLVPEKFTVGGAPSATADVIKKLAGNPFADPPKYGTAYDCVGKEGCKALYSLGAIGSIDTMIANFLTSLQQLVDVDSRVHCSLNLNTETGRLSSRRPNLQNQPALEKDKYKIRQAFQASPGNNLIVADYGQLELRILASITKCVPMIDAFASGGDFHSRTAIDMFDHVRKAVESGECLLEWDYNKGDPPKPLLKDKFASERRKAKTLNFSIAYGKTAHGLSADWGVSKTEAEAMLEAWYQARTEVRDWQKKRKTEAWEKGITKTLMGRIRDLPGAQAKGKARGHAERASINTPIQGGAADIAMMAMIKINNSERLKELGWILILQIHDEVILEGPEETAKEAYKEVIHCMEEPWVYGLPKMSVPLVVDGSYKHKTWYDAK